MCLLIDTGANVEARSPFGGTALHLTAGSLRREALLYLLKRHFLGRFLRNTAWCARQVQPAQQVDCLLRARANEALLNEEGHTVANMIEELVREEYRLIEDIERVRELLTNAPADRAWRHRDYLALCSAEPDRVQLEHLTSGTNHYNIAQRTRAGAKLTRAGEVAGCSAVDKKTVGDWADVVAKWWRCLQKEGVFRTMVGTCEAGEMNLRTVCAATKSHTIMCHMLLLGGQGFEHV